MPKYIAPCTFFDGVIRPDDPGELARYKNSLTDGARLQMSIEPLPNKRSRRAFNLFHALVTAYSKDQGVDREHAKIGFKLQHGVIIPIEHGLTSNRHGQVVELPSGKFVFAISTNEYTVEEMYRLIRGTINECLDSQTDIGDIIMEWRALKPDEVS